MLDHLNTEHVREFDSLTGEARAQVLLHAESCERCRLALLEQDPSRVFALLGGAPIPAAALDRLSDRVAQAVDLASSPTLHRSRWFGAAALAASLLFAAVVGAVLWTHELPEQRIARMDEIIALEPLEEEVAGFRMVSSPGDDSQVLDLSIGETQVLIVFNEALEL